MPPLYTTKRNPKNRQALTLHTTKTCPLIRGRETVRVREADLQGRTTKKCGGCNKGA